MVLLDGLDEQLVGCVGLAFDENDPGKITEEQFAIVVSSGPLPCCCVDTSFAAVVVQEADTFWCMGTLLDGIQDHYIFAQPGIQKMVGFLA